MLFRSAINWGNIRSPDDFAKPADLLVRALNEILDYQNYPIMAAEMGTKSRRPLGIGLINLAYWMAKNNMTYSEPNFELIHEWAEAWSYYLIKASVDLAEERGEAPSKINETKYADGIFPIDTYKKNVDNLVKPKYNMDWKGLKEIGRAHV